nr:hypothetical protein [Tanacetum cinerariifolium]
TVMSDSEDSIITYTVVSSPFGGLSDIRSPGVDGPPVMPEGTYAYVEAAFQAPPSLDYVPGPEYPPSPEFIPEPSDPKDDLEEDPADYPADGGDEGDDEDESSDDDEDDDIDIEGDEDEYLALADSAAVALPAIDHAPSAEETKPFETDESATTPPPHPAYRVTARIPFGGLSDIRSPGVDGPPVMPEGTYAYVEAAFQAPPS